MDLFSNPLLRGAMMAAQSLDFRDSNADNNAGGIGSSSSSSSTNSLPARQAEAATINQAINQNQEMRGIQIQYIEQEEEIDLSRSIDDIEAEMGIVTEKGGEEKIESGGVEHEEQKEQEEVGSIVGIL